ncbi:hypothetical protein [Olleya namhaensis]|uniref:hypothetical protein n=1 Tax=Olleya namhaensis TaxID=1144750 RepID=UPI00249167FF|nr:hypothetical protein [Olleya namhaensis]
MRKNINKDCIPLLFALLLMLVSIGTEITNYAILNYKHYIGFSLITVSTVLYFQNKKLFVYFFLITLLLGLANVVDLFYWNVSINLSHVIKINPIFLTLLALFMGLNNKIINTIFPEKEIKTTENIKLIKQYQAKFESKSETELKNIADPKSRYVKEAKIASNNILRKRII